MRIDITQLENYHCSILTDTGYEYVSQTITKREPCVEVHFSDWTILKVAETHLFELNTGQWKFAKDLLEDEVVLTETGATTVLNKISIGIHTVYDLTVDSEKHQYYLDGVSSHNTGKNYVATSSACKLMDRDKRYQKIVYLRKTLVSEDKSAELGFLKGGLEEKLFPYLAPMENTIEGFLKSKHKDKKYTTQQLETDKEEFKAKYPIEYPWSGHMRGTTITNAIVILDEAANFTVADLQMLLTRIGNDCKVLILGSVRQIDNPFLNKYNNGLTYLMDKATKDNGEVRLVACTLDTTVRSKIAEWADTFND